MEKKLVKHGNTLAITIEKTLLASVGLDENTVFQVVAIPGVGIVIQSSHDYDHDLCNKAYEKVKNKYNKVFKNLSDR